MLLRKVIQSFKKHKVPYAIVGGHAVALHGAVRGTIDIDFIIKWSLKNLNAFEKALNDIGLQSRLPITADDLFNFKDEYIKNRNLIAWNFTNASDPSEQIDLVINFDLTNASVKKIKIQNETYNVISKKDLIRMKKISARKQDLLDIEALERLDEI
ncbi:MAG: hypothetical protein ACPGJV_03160 [Bacteriovoracaceae bacterium]